jgi:outer membrane protein TolC
MRKLGLAIFLIAGAVCAQERTITLREAVDLALKQNPDIALARLDERKAGEAVRVAQDPFVPKIAVGSGLAYSSGLPMSIEGATPSIFQAQATKFVFNRQQTNLVAQAREDARGVTITTAAKREEIALRAALAYLEAERAARIADLLQREVDSLERVAQTVRLRIGEGRELPAEARRADLNLAKARQRLQAIQGDRAYAESSLASLLGFDADVPVRVVVEDRSPLTLPQSEEDSASEAIASSKELRRLESAMMAKGFEVKADKAARLPRVDLVAQYALLGKFNNYEQFFNKFQRHNGQLGVSFTVPLFAGPGADALAAQATGEVARLRLEMQAARNRIAMDSRRLYRQVKQAETGLDVARLDLEVARDDLSLLLARMEEGRTSLREVEQARLAEDEKWMAFIDANYTLETAKLNLLHETGDLLAALR